MTIEDTIRTEMMRLQQLLGRLERFKQQYESTVKCLDKDHKWKSIGIKSVQSGDAIKAWVDETLECTVCGVRKFRKYEMTGETNGDPWSDLREDEEE